MRAPMNKMGGIGGKAQKLNPRQKEKPTLAANQTCPQTTTNPKPTNHDPVAAVDIPSSAVASQPMAAAGSVAVAAAVLVQQQR
jgi:hypothetical protein